MFEFLMITLIILLATISPGPDFAIVSRNALRYNYKMGLVTALGIGCGTVFHSIYCILGFAIIISRSLFLFTVIKYIGAAYLIYLGIKGLLEKKNGTEVDSLESSDGLTTLQAFRQGLLCTMLNPKAIMFFLAFFTIIVKPTMPFVVQASYALEIMLIDFVWFVGVSYLFSHQKIKSALGNGLHYVTKVCGGALIMFGLKIVA